MVAASVSAGNCFRVRRTGNGQNSDGRRGVRGSEKPGSAKDQTDPFLAFVARLMDTAFTIPGTNIRFGLDPVIGLIPGIGDCVATLISTLLILQSARYRLPKIVLTRMALNVLINAAVGAVPFVGDIFSVFFRSNARNYALLQRHAGARRTSTIGDWLFVAGLIGAMLLIVVLILVGAFVLLRKLFAAAN
jgi:hypothetical protein